MAKKSQKWYDSMRRYPSLAGMSNEEIDAMMASNGPRPGVKPVDLPPPIESGTGEHGPVTMGSTSKSPPAPREVGPVATPEALASTAASGDNPGVDLTAMFGEIVEAAGGAADALDELAKEANSVLGAPEGVPEAKPADPGPVPLASETDTHRVNPPEGSTGAPSPDDIRDLVDAHELSEKAKKKKKRPTADSVLGEMLGGVAQFVEDATGMDVGGGGGLADLLGGGGGRGKKPPKAPPGGDEGENDEGGLLGEVKGKHAPGSLAAKAFIGGGFEGLAGKGPGGFGASAILGGATMEAAVSDPLSIAAMEVTRRAKGLVELPGKVGSAMGDAALNAAQTEKVGEIGGHLLKGAGESVEAYSETLGPVEGAAVKAAGGLIKLSGGALQSFERLRDWTTGLHESNKRFAEYSAGMAQVSAQQEMRQIQLDRERGDRRANTARELAESRDRLNRALAPIEDAWGNLMNQLGATINTALTPVVEKIAAALGIDKDPGEGDNFALNNTGEQAISEAARRGWIEDYGVGARNRVLDEQMRARRGG